MKCAQHCVQTLVDTQEVILVSFCCDLFFFELKIFLPGASLVAQWLRICLPMQRTQVRALAREDPTCRGATNPVRHNY